MPSPPGVLSHALLLSAFSTHGLQPCTWEGREAEQNLAQQGGKLGGVQDTLQKYRQTTVV